MRFLMTVTAAGLRRLRSCSRKRVADEPALATYQHLPSVRTDLLARLGRYREADGEFRRAAGLTRNLTERAVLLRRAADCAAKRT
jgi:predicted RNA polymerase sigma factor